MDRRHRPRTIAATLFAIAALVASTTSASAQSPTPEDEAKLAAYQAFLAHLDEFLPTVEHIDHASLPVTFPFEDVLEHVVVEVAFGDDEPVPFMFDTGAPTFVSPAIAKAHGGDVITEQVSIAGGGTILWSPIQTYPSLTVGDSLTITDATAITPWSPDGALHCVTPDGLLGASAMRNAVWQIDYGTHAITVAASVDQLDHVDGAIAIPFVPQQAMSPTPVVELGVGDGTLKFLVDTGGGIPLAINTADLAKVGVAIPADSPVAANLAAGAAGMFEAPLTFLDVPIRFGDTEIVTPIVAADGMAPTANGNMGHSFLKNFVITFDWSNDTMYLDPIAEDGTVPPLPDPPGAGFGLQDGKVVVNALAKGGPADEAGLKMGEVVSSVDGTSVEGISLDDLCGILRAGEHQTLTTQSGKSYDISPVAGFFD